MWAAFFPPHLHEHPAVWLEDLFQLSHSSDAPIRWRVRVVYFYSWGNPTDLRNRGIRTREKRGVAVLPSKCRHATVEKATITDKFPPPYKVLPHTAAYRAGGRTGQNGDPVRPAHSGVTLVHVTNICHLRIFDTSCEQSIVQTGTNYKITSGQ